MLIPPKYVLTHKIAEYLQLIESSKEVINSISIPLEIEINIRRRSTLRSSLFSARIEGNTLTLDELSRSSLKDQKKVEVFNILKALNQMQQRLAREISLADICRFHQIIMSNLIALDSLGKFRTQASAIFNSVGIAIYMPPRPSQVNPLLNKLVTFANSPKEHFVPIRACLAHYIFEKIHPFLDGNGRVGRLILQAVLKQGGYGMKGLLALEEYLDQERTEYYRGLEDSERDVTGYLEFMLKTVSEAAEEAKNQVIQSQKAEPTDFLLPRRAEIVQLIKDQKLISFDQIKRRFLKVNERTLRYDLKKLQDTGLIRKRGATRGVYYECYK